MKGKPMDIKHFSKRKGGKTFDVIGHLSAKEILQLKRDGYRWNGQHENKHGIPVGRRKRA